MDLTDEARKEWLMLARLHEQCPHSGEHAGTRRGEPSRAHSQQLLSQVQCLICPTQSRRWATATRAISCQRAKRARRRSKAHRNPYCPF